MIQVTQSEAMLKMFGVLLPTASEKFTVQLLYKTPHFNMDLQGFS